MPGVIHRVLETGVLLLCILDVHHALRYAHVPRRRAERASSDWARSSVWTSGGEVRRLGSARRRMRLKENLQTLCVWFVYMSIFPMIEGILGWIIPFWSTIQTLWLLWMLANRRIPAVSRHELYIDDATRWIHGFLLFLVNIIGSTRMFSHAVCERFVLRKEAMEQSQTSFSATQLFSNLENHDDTVAEPGSSVVSQPVPDSESNCIQEHSTRQEEQNKHVESSYTSVQAPATSIQSSSAPASQPAMDLQNCEAGNNAAPQSTVYPLASIDSPKRHGIQSRSPRTSTNKFETAEMLLRDSLISRAEHRSKRNTAPLNESTALPYSTSPSQLGTSTLIPKGCALKPSFSKEKTQIHGSNDDIISSDALPEYTNSKNIRPGKHADLAPSATPAKRSPLEPVAERNVRTRRNLQQIQMDTVGSAKRVTRSVRTGMNSHLGSFSEPKPQHKFARSEQRAVSQTSLLPRPSRIIATEFEPSLRRSVRTRSTTNHTVIR